MTDARRTAPHVARNAVPILEVLRDVLPAEGLVLEIASGSGEHVLAFAHGFPNLAWQPSDPDPVALASIEAWRAAEGAPNLLAPLRLDAAAPDWPLERADAILCINMVHISPWSATLGLLYGAYRREGVPTALSNEAFDRSLRERNPDWGVRRLEDVAAEAERRSLALDRVIEMPANNLSVIFRRL